MEFERLDFVEAIEELASYLGLDVLENSAAARYQQHLEPTANKNVTYMI